MPWKFIVILAAVSLSGCSMKAANHDPIWILTVAGNYKAVAACSFDRIHRDNSLVNTAVNEVRLTAQVWAASGSSTIMELTFTQIGLDHVRVEYRNTYLIDVSAEKTPL